ncbi:MAG TPA: LLM class flavin-dependent oxidoreductase [Candidatus Methylacidiphilales bacterium]|nr:LLM class flavin-dependent oxidoreductase [Candidatus Methylacidiphilales bacterium]
MSTHQPGDKNEVIYKTCHARSGRTSARLLLQHRFLTYMIPFSILDLSPITQGATARDALRNTLDLARHAEALGYRRYWLAEHHNMTGIASAATSVVIGYVAGGTNSIRVGAGGIMLPNHSPLVIAEQFGTLASLYPNRIDLGLGRAPGSDMATARALRRDPVTAADRFPEDVAELQDYLASEEGDGEARANDESEGPTIPGFPGIRFHLPKPQRTNGKIRAIPGSGTEVPLWILGSSLFGAKLAAEMGLPFTFASHFAPDNLLEAFALYRSRFKPSRQLQRPFAMMAVNVFAADTDDEAQRHFTTLQQLFINLRRGTPGQVPPPVDAIEDYALPAEISLAHHMLRYSAVGSAETVAERLREIMNETDPDELMITGHFFNHAARLRSFEIVARVREML